MVSIYSSSAGETANASGVYVAPVSRQLKGIHFLTDSIAKIAHNFADGGEGGSVVGSPTVAADGTTLTDNVSFVQTAVVEAALMTFFVVAKSDANFASVDGSMLFSTNGGSVQSGGSNTFGTSLYMTSAGIVFGSSRDNAGTATSAAAAISGNNNAAWALYQCDVTATGNTVTNLTTGATAINSVGATKIITNGAFRIGANATATWTGTSKVLAWVAHHDVLTTQEKADWAARLRKYAAARGITV